VNRRHLPALLALLAIAFLGSYLLYTQRLVRDIRAVAETQTRMYGVVLQGLYSPVPGAELEALTLLPAKFGELGIPVVVLDVGGEPSATMNLPFDPDLGSAEGHARVLAYARRLGRENPPVTEPGIGRIYYGSPPLLRTLRWVPLLQVTGALLLLFIAVAVVRANLRAERERMWAAMARELAHQMGTPLSSLTGWVEVLRLPEQERALLVSPRKAADEIAADVERLERVSRRFELIGRPPVLKPVAVQELLDELERYLRPRLPRMGSGVELRTRAAPGLPPLRANPVLLVWALENLLKNALDALAGRGGRILVVAAPDGDRVRIVVADDGPGIPAAVRARVFEPGVSTKSAGWGVGLSLTRRIVERVHGGRITVRPRRSGGTIFDIRLPALARAPAGEHDG
jgi:signal transduction histidine kinase